MTLITKVELFTYTLGTLLFGFLLPHIARVMDSGMHAFVEFFNQPYTPNAMAYLDWYWYYIMALGASVATWGIREYNGRRELKRLERENH